MCGKTILKIKTLEWKENLTFISILFKSINWSLELLYCKVSLEMYLNSVADTSGGKHNCLRYQREK